MREIERLYAEEALRASEARFRTLCQAVPMGIFECDGTVVIAPISARNGNRSPAAPTRN